MTSAICTDIEKRHPGPDTDREQTMKKLAIAVAGLAMLTVTTALAADKMNAFENARQRMVSRDIRSRGITDPRVLKAMAEVPRHRFVPDSLRSQAYADRPLPIGEGQTISQPYIVALMTEILDLKASATVLEIGTGSGYQAAVLSKVAAQVFTIEIKEGLYRSAVKVLAATGCSNVSATHGDGYFGWQTKAPFDGMVELYFDSIEEMKAQWSGAQDEIMKEDEKNFCDPNYRVFVLTDEHVIAEK